MDFGGLGVLVFVPFVWRADEEGVDVVFPEKFVPVTAMAVLRLVRAF